MESQLPFLLYDRCRMPEVLEYSFSRRHWILINLVDKPPLVPDIQIRKLSQDGHLAPHPGRLPQLLRNQDSPLAIQLDGLAEVVGAIEELFLGLVERGQARQLVFNLPPDGERIDANEIAVQAGEVKLRAVVFFKHCFKGRRDFESPLAVHRRHVRAA